MKKLYLLFLPFLALCSCGANKRDPSKTLINFFGWGSAEEKAVFNAMIAKFKEIHPEYDVHYESSSSELYMNALLTKRQSDTMPDVFYMPDTNFIEWANSRNNVMMNLTPFIEASKTFSTDNVWFEGLNAYRFDAANKRLGTGDLYALPKDVGPIALTYNKTNALKKGITISSETSPNGYGYDANTKTVYQSTPMTWAQFIKFCKDTQTGDPKDHDSIVGITHYPLETAYFTAGGDFTDSTRKISTIANDKFAESLQFVADLALKFNVMTAAEDQGGGGQDGYSRFISGLASSSFIDFYKLPEMWRCNFDWDVLPTPVPNQSGSLEKEDDWKDAPRSGCTTQSYLGSVGIAVCKTTGVPQAAYELAEFLTVNQEAQRINYKMGQALPNLKDMAKGEFLTATLDDGKGLNRPLNRQVYIDIAENSKRRPASYTYNDKWSQEMWESANDSLKLYRVFHNDRQYGGHIDVWDWSTKSRINNSFLDSLQASVQVKLNDYANKYSW